MFSESLLDFGKCPKLDNYDDDDDNDDNDSLRLWNRYSLRIGHHSLL